MLHLVTSYMKQSTSRKQTLESALAGVGGGGGVLSQILDRGVPRRFLNPNPV